MAAPPTTVRLQIHLQPRAARSRLVGRRGDTIKVQVHAPPVDGAANAALINLLAETCDVPRRAVRIVRGEKGRDKVVEIEDHNVSAALRRLNEALGVCVDKPKSRD